MSRGDPAAGPRSAATPAPTETFLFTDIEGSTRLVQLLGDAYPEVLQDHRRVLLGAVESNGGVERSTAGDGSLFVFPSARSAVAAAVEAQRALAAHPWPEGAPVRVRMGLHTGESRRVPARDAEGGPVAQPAERAAGLAQAEGIHAGLDVYRAARIAAAGHGGQVLLSQTTRQLVERDLPSDVTLKDLGAHQLKDLQQPEHIWQLVLRGLPAEFPPLRTLAARPTNLPAQSTPFIGREQELENVRQLLLRTAVRLVTLTGPGGMGKTRLALQAAAALLEDFADGVFVIPLGSVSEPGMIPARIAETLGLPENPSGSALAALQDHLRTRELLLVLDNFEQVVAGGPDVAALLAECPRIKALITSRIVLHLRGEHEFQVPPLPVPDPRRPDDAEALEAYASVALFVERARAAKPDFELAPENAAAVARICANLDGLPLAIELAAARIKLFPPQAMLSRLGRRLDLLKGGARDLPQRQQTLRQAMAWSYDLLDADERAYFRRAAVFRGGFTLDAVEPVCNAGGDLALDPVEAVAALIDNSLLRRLDDAGDEPRFVMLGTIQEYGLECLRATAEEDPVRRAHAEYFLTLAEEAAPELTGGRQAFWLDRLEADRDNLLSALDWVEARAEAELGVRFGAALWRFWVSRGHLIEGRARLERILELPGAAAPSAARAQVLAGTGTLLHEMSDYETAHRLLDESLSIWRGLGDREGQANALSNIGWIAGIEGDIDRARAYADEALALYRELGNARGVAVALHNLSWLAMAQADYGQARALITDALAWRRKAGDQRGAAYMKANLALLDRIEGNHAAAWAMAEEALAGLRELGDRQLIAWAMEVQGRIAHGEGDLERAELLLREAITIWSEVGNRDAFAWSLGELAGVLRDRGELDLAAAAADEGLALVRKSIVRFTINYVQVTAGWIALDRGDIAGAANVFSEALEMCRPTGDRRGYAEVLEGFAEVHSRQGNLERAARLLGHADSLRAAIGAPMPRIQRQRHDERLGALRTAIGEAAFAAAWDEGAAMATDAALAEAQVPAGTPAAPAR